MQDIFVSTAQECLGNWKKAFPKCKLIQHSFQLESVLAAEQGQAVMFWLHMHDRLNLAGAIAAIVKHCPPAKIVVLDNDPSHTQSLQALSAGAMGYAHAYSAPKLLTEIKAVISHGGIWLGQQLLQRLIETSTQRVGGSPEYVDNLLKQLTKREQQVALEAAKGQSNKEIARVLNITERTVKAHLAATFERLHVKDRLQLALMLNKKETPVPQSAEVAALKTLEQPAAKPKSNTKSNAKKVGKPSRRVPTAKLA